MVGPVYSAILRVEDFIFWLRAVHPYSILGFKSQSPSRKLPIEPREGQSHLTDLKICQNLDFFKLGQRRLETCGMVLVERKVVCIGPF